MNPMKKPIWWFRRCIQCWDESIELVESSEIERYESDEEWDNFWFWQSMPDMPSGDAFPGLDKLVSRQES